MKDSSSPIIVAVIVLAGAVGGFLYWQRRKAPTPPPPAPVAQAPTVNPVPAPPPPDAAAPPPIQHPIAGGGGKLPSLDDSDGFITKALTDLFGRKGVASFLALDGFARRFVATVDNLGNEQAPARMWPVNPMTGQFDVETRGDLQVASGRNVRRYAPLVRFAESVDTGKAVAVYSRLYPLFQQAYEELGYSGMYFNDRLIEVIDHLLATPEVPGPIKVKLVEAQGATRPLYQFEDPGLERRSSGQKILLRVGQENAAVLKGKLREVREALTRSAPARKRKRR